MMKGGMMVDGTKYNSGRNRTLFGVLSNYNMGDINITINDREC
jgi:hypothetical protein